MVTQFRSINPPATSVGVTTQVKAPGYLPEGGYEFIPAPTPEDYDRVAENIDKLSGTLAAISEGIAVAALAGAQAGPALQALAISLGALAGLAAEHADSLREKSRELERQLQPSPDTPGVVDDSRTESSPLSKVAPGGHATPSPPLSHDDKEDIPCPESPGMAAQEAGDLLHNAVERIDAGGAAVETAGGHLSTAVAGFEATVATWQKSLADNGVSANVINASYGGRTGSDGASQTAAIWPPEAAEGLALLGEAVPPMAEAVPPMAEAAGVIAAAGENFAAAAESLRAGRPPPAGESGLVAGGAEDAGAVFAASEAMDDAARMVRDVGAEVDGVNQEILGGTRAAMSEVESLITGALTSGKLAWQDLAVVAIQAIFEILEAQITAMLTEAAVRAATGGAGFGGGGFSFGGSVPGPHLQHGGTVAAGQAVVVGEAGREVFRPKAPGEIIPNHRLGGFGATNSVVNVTYNVDARGADPGVEQRLRRMLAENNRTVRRDVMQAIWDDARRGGPFSRLPRR